MEFRFTEDQLTFHASLRKALEKECTVAHLRALWATETGRSPERWAKLAELGLLGLLVPGEHGGLGMNEVDLVLLLEETGRVALPEPVIETAAVGAPLLAATKLAEEWLPKVAVGEAIVTFGHPLNPFVTDAHVADLLLLPHGDELHAVPRVQVALQHEPCSDASRRLFRVNWTPKAATRVAQGTDAQRLLAAALDRAALACAAQQLGIGQQMLDLGVRYATERQQFGKPIGSFQAVKHLLANVAVRIEFARPVVYRAAFSVAHETAARAVDVSHAKVAASEAAVLAAKTVHQVHGAMGYTWECDLHIWMKRAWALEAAWGTSAWHRARVAAAVIDGRGPAATFGYSAPGA
ncbi:MAG: acyl-CoA/acyl-ACP dehydrogenase [Deltaproteobacteria bacterium]|nr:acyl-CoA/acyl-ACP dehydrogenase [Deltaproteobacteria bacterium]